MLNRLSVCGLAALAVTSPSIAGELNPPAGPIAETGRFGPRTEINAQNTPGSATSLFVIGQAGSYYLSGNIVGVAGKNGIEITVADVTLDLNGFRLDGDTNSSLSGVLATGAGNVRVRNGFVRGWGNHGIDLSGGANCELRDVTATFNSVDGLRMGPSGSVESCSAFFSGADGISAGTGCLISDCKVLASFAHGIVAGDGNIVSDCSAGNSTLDGIAAGLGCTISACTSGDNGASGISAGGASTIIACSAVSNMDWGIITVSSLIESCAVSGSGNDGILAGSGSTIRNSFAEDNGQSGVVCGDACRICGVTSRGNAVDGFAVGDNCTISGSSAIGNTENGIQVASKCLVFDNACSDNGVVLLDASIFVTGDGNRIDGNYVYAGAPYGYRIVGSENLVVRNTIRSIGTTSTTAGNSVAEFIVSPGIGFVASNPWANILLP